MGSNEMTRLLEIKSKVQRLRKESLKVTQRYERARDDKRAIDQTLKRLEDEWTKIVQGQLIFDEPAFAAS